MWGRLWPLLLSFLTATAVPGPLLRRPSRELDATPRITIPYEELSGTQHFKGRAQNYSTLLLEEASARLLVGARGALFSLNAHNIGDGTHKEIHWEASPEMQSKCHQKGKNNQTECFNHVRFLQRLNATHLYTCGTHAFQPLCAAIDAEAFTLPTSFEEGKEKCPYDPARGFTGLIIDGGLYTATRYEFRSIPDIRRSRHPHSLRTEEAPMHWLNDAEFVFSVLVWESKASAVGDDDKVYYFFTERAAEEGSGSFAQSRSSHRVARVARVCKGDLGGKKILQKKWTSFLKAHPGGLSHLPLRPGRGAGCLRRPLHGIPGWCPTLGPLRGRGAGAPAWLADGWIHKAVVLGSGMHIIEETQVFKKPQSVENLVISPTQHSLYVGAPSGVIQLSLSSCSRYRSCYDCILARDPYCGWDPGNHACVVTTTGANRSQGSRTALIQDIERGNRGCEGNRDTGPPPPLKTRSVLRGDDVLLPCDQPSNLARALWMLNGSMGLSDGQDGYRVGVDGLLVTDTQPEHSGNYGCYAEENGLRTLLASYSLTVRPATPAPASQAPAMPGAQLAPDMRLLYVLAIATLGGLCLILASSLFYVACLRRGGRGHRQKYSLGRAGRAGGSAVQLQTVSGQCPGEEDGDDGEGAGGLEGGCLQIIPGEGAPAPPPPPPPPPPAELTNGLVALPSRLRRMNGNSYVLLRQSNNGVPAGPCSFAEELSRILEKRKHTQLVEHLDESSV
ncbi:semaphorin-4G isoform 5-T5 [Megaptera novaeangliae]